MKKSINNTTARLVLVMILVVSICTNISLCSRRTSVLPYNSNTPIRDTIFDTIPFYKPTPKDSTVIKYISVKPSDINDDENTPISDGIFLSDSSDVIIPIIQKVYTDDSIYTAYVSGYMTSLDSLLFIKKTETIINTTSLTHSTCKDKRLSIGIQIGYGVTINKTPQFTPYIGVGLSYKLFNF